MNKEIITGYSLEEEKSLCDIDSAGYVLRHKKSGARVILIENDDNNKPKKPTGSDTPPTPTSGGGDTFIFQSPKPIDEVQAARMLRNTKRDLAEGF